MLAFLIISTFISVVLTRVNTDDVDDNKIYYADQSQVGENKDLGNCPCDLTDQCDENCCCDPDCPSKENLFATCLDETPGLSESRRKALRKCSDPAITGDGTLLDWIQRTMLCVSRNNNPSPGKYYEIKSKFIEAQQIYENESSFANLFQEEKPQKLRPLIDSINLTKHTNIVETIQNNNITDELPNITDELRNITVLYLQSYSTKYPIKFNNNSPTDPSKDENSESATEDETSNDQTVISCINITIGNCNETCIEICNSDVLCECCSSNIDINKTSDNEIEGKINIKWETNQNAIITPRGYLFGEPLLDEKNEPFRLSSGYACNQSTDILFGASVDYTCLTNNLTINETSYTEFLLENGILSLKGFISTKLKQIPYGYSSSLGNDFIDIVMPTDFEINTTAWSGTNRTLSNIIRVIDIYYKTIGTTQNPQHILTNITVSYNYSTTIVQRIGAGTNYLSTEYHLPLRTVVRYFVCPNNQNMFKEVSANSKLQAWLPF